jgi:L-lysine 2,3-aminomutase
MSLGSRKFLVNSAKGTTEFKEQTAIFEDGRRGVKENSKLHHPQRITKCYLDLLDKQRPHD